MCKKLHFYNFQVHISFLYVGHTHEDIDAAFSKISEKLRKNDAETIPDIINLVSGMEKINYIWDVKKWLSPEMNKTVGISEPLHFKISRHGKNIRVQFKGQQHTQWTVLGGRGSFLKRIPTKRPSIVKPNFDKIKEKKELLSKLIFNIKNLFNDKNSFEWWVQFLDKIEKNQQPKDKFLMTQLPRQPNNKKMKRNMDGLDPITRTMLEKETSKPQVGFKLLVCLHFMRLG